MSAMGCAEYGPEVSAYLDEGLADDERRRMELHLARCACCAALLRASRELDGSVRALPRIEPSAGFDASLRARLAPARSAPPRWRGRGALARFGGIAAAAAALLAVLIAPGGSTLSEDDWELLSDEETFDLMLSDDHELVSSLDVLEAWDEKDDL